MTEEPAAVAPVAPKKAEIQLTKRSPPDLALYIFERGDEISFLLQSADGRHNMDDYPPVKLRTPREHFQEFFRTIEKLDAEGRPGEARQPGTQPVPTARPEELQRALWSLKDRVRHVADHFGRAVDPVGGVQLEGRGRRQRRGRSVLRRGLQGDALVSAACRRCRASPSTTSRWWCRRFGPRQRSRREEVHRRPAQRHAARRQHRATRDDVTQAMQAATYDGWHFTGHARAARPANADQAPIELENSEKLTPSDIVGRTSNVLKPRPFVFLNACQSAQAGMSLTGVGGLGAALHQGAVGSSVAARSSAPTGRSTTTRRSRLRRRSTSD
jgi:hypothetical protein